VSPAYCEGVAQLARDNKITLLTKEFEASDVKTQVLIVSATDDVVLNIKVSELAKNANIPVNVVDSPN
jgi:uroporphyrin-III C-methyltransferase/precorrin-2 dehydrogenase/sirohydrochlorin ferrochelatase